MKRTIIILAFGAVIACAVILFSRSGNPQKDTAPPSNETDAAETNTRNRPERESGSAGAEDETSPTGSASSVSVKDPEAALAKAAAQLKDPELSTTLAEILGSWAETDPLAALAWVDQSGPGRENPEELRAHILFTWSNKHPDAAATWLEENPGMQQPANLLALLGPWMDSSPEAAVAWSTTRIETVQREGILADLLVSCGSGENALALLGEVDPVVADNALQAAVTSIADEDPELAKKLSALITSPADSPEEKPQLESVAPSPAAPPER
ncbi:MAG: hypothetical protein EOP88_16320 [Verrucomicrobiaceae bacterium]|nr:MAG: hypothetical protein EOP88_16320 [Verrucomicrobiaceae bacterium]